MLLQLLLWLLRWLLLTLTPVSLAFCQKVKDFVQLLFANPVDLFSHVCFEPCCLFTFQPGYCLQKSHRLLSQLLPALLLILCHAPPPYKIVASHAQQHGVINTSLWDVIHLRLAD